MRQSGASDSAIDAHLDHLWLEHGLSRATLASYRRDLTAFAHWLDRDLHAATEADVHQYLADRLAIGRSPRTIARFLSAARSFYRRAAESGAVDYLLAGTVFRSASKPGRRALGLDALRDIVRASTRPVLAIGGVRVTDGPAVAATGAAGVAGIRLFRFASSRERRGQLASRVQALRAAFDRRGSLD